jgi:hypothetical protein
MRTAAGAPAGAASARPLIIIPPAANAAAVIVRRYPRILFSPNDADLPHSNAGWQHNSVNIGLVPLLLPVRLPKSSCISRGIEAGCDPCNSDNRLPTSGKRTDVDRGDYRQGTTSFTGLVNNRYAREFK